MALNQDTKDGGWEQIEEAEVECVQIKSGINSDP